MPIESLRKFSLLNIRRGSLKKARSTPMASKGGKHHKSKSQTFYETDKPVSKKEQSNHLKTESLNKHNKKERNNNNNNNNSNSNNNDQPKHLSPQLTAIPQNSLNSHSYSEDEERLPKSMPEKNIRNTILSDVNENNNNNMHSMVLNKEDSSNSSNHSNDNHKHKAKNHKNNIKNNNIKNTASDDDENDDKMNEMNELETQQMEDRKRIYKLIRALVLDAHETVARVADQLKRYMEEPKIGVGGTRSHRASAIGNTNDAAIHTTTIRENSVLSPTVISVTNENNIKTSSVDIANIPTKAASILGTLTPANHMHNNNNNNNSGNINATNLNVNITNITHTYGQQPYHQQGRTMTPPTILDISDGLSRERRSDSAFFGDGTKENDSQWLGGIEYIFHILCLVLFFLFFVFFCFFCFLFCFLYDIIVCVQCNTVCRGGVIL